MAIGVVRKLQQLDLKRRHHGGVGEDLDLGDGVADDVEGEDRSGPPARRPHRARGAVDDSWPGPHRPPRQGHGHGPGATHLGRQQGRSPVAVGGSRFNRSAIGPQDSVRVEQVDERLEVPPAGGGQEGLDDLMLAAPISEGLLVVALDAPPGPAGQLAGGGRRAIDDRRDVLEWHREHVVEHERRVAPRE